MEGIDNLKIIVKSEDVAKYLTNTRAKIIKVIAMSGKMSQKELSRIMKISNSNLSYHIKVLENLGIIKKEKEIIFENGQYKHINMLSYEPDNDIIELEVVK